MWHVCECWVCAAGAGGGHGDLWASEMLSHLFAKGRVFFGAKNFFAIPVLVNSTLICFRHWRPLLGHIYISHIFQLIQLPVFSQWRTPTSLFVLPFLS